jgi:sodium/proline symporter
LRYAKGVFDYIWYSLSNSAFYNEAELLAKATVAQFDFDGVTSIYTPKLYSAFGKDGYKTLPPNLSKTALTIGGNPLLAGLLMSAVIAASMSTADSQLLVASSSFTSDIYKTAIRKKAQDKEVMWVGRAVVVIVAIIAFFIANSEGEGAAAIMNLVSNAWAGFGSAFGPVVILSLFWKRFNYAGALAGVIAGALVDVIWLFAGIASATGIYELIPGFIAGLIAAVVVTLLTKKPDAVVEAIYETATNPELED